MALKGKFCPKCGKEVKDLYDSLCADCYIGFSTISFPKSTSVKYCTVCKSVLIKNIWISVSESPKFYLERKLAEKIKLPPFEKLKGVKILKVGKPTEVKIVSELREKKFERIKKIDATVEKYACPECSRQFKTSVTAIIQLRSKGNPEKLINSVLGFIGSAKRKIVNAEEHLHGIDFSFSDKRTARVLARKIKDSFDCVMIESVKQRGFDKSKYRPLVQVTYLLRCKR